MKPAIDFNGYLINKVQFERKSIPENEDESTLQIGLNITIAHDENDEKNIKADLTVNVSGYVDSEMSISGFFKANDDISNFGDGDIPAITASILIPYVRSLISFISAADGNTPIIIPTVNLNEAFVSESETNQIQKEPE